MMVPMPSGGGLSAVTHPPRRARATPHATSGPLGEARWLLRVPRPGSSCWRGEWRVGRLGRCADPFGQCFISARWNVARRPKSLRIANAIRRSPGAHAGSPSQMRLRVRFVLCEPSASAGALLTLAQATLDGPVRCDWCGAATHRVPSRLSPRLPRLRVTRTSASNSATGRMQ